MINEIKMGKSLKNWGKMYCCDSRWIGR